MLRSIVAMTSATTTCSATVLGVEFRWNLDVPDWHPRIRTGYHTLHNQLAQAVSPALHRQKRDYLGYWDAMSPLEFGRRPITEDLWGDETVHLGIELALQSRMGVPSDTLIERLIALEPVANARTRIHRQYGDGDGARASALARAGTGNTKFDANGRPHLLPGLYRYTSLDMGHELPEGPEAINWPFLMVLSVLINLRLDVELYLETGIWRIVSCKRRECRAFFPQRSFSGRRPRFCSATCRASAAREQ